MGRETIIKLAFAAAAVAASVYVGDNFTQTPEQGAEFLKSGGYTQVIGGEREALSGALCLSGHSTVRTYEVTNKDGKKEEIRVCFSGYGNASKPLVQF